MEKTLKQTIQDKVDTLLKELQKMSDCELRTLNLNTVFFDTKENKEFTVDINYNFIDNTLKLNNELLEDMPLNDTPLNVEQLGGNLLTENTLSTDIFRTSFSVKDSDNLQSANFLKGGFTNQVLSATSTLNTENNNFDKVMSATSPLNTEINNLLTQTGGNSSNIKLKLPVFNMNSGNNIFGGSKNLSKMDLIRNKIRELDLMSDFDNSKTFFTQHGAGISNKKYFSGKEIGINSTSTSSLCE